MEKKPWLCASTPRPSQRGQIFGDVPGAAPFPPQVAQRSDFGTVTSQNVSGQMYQQPFQLRFGVRFEF